MQSSTRCAPIAKICAISLEAIYACENQTESWNFIILSSILFGIKGWFSEMSFAS